jgi:hypothetical protein
MQVVHRQRGLYTPEEVSARAISYVATNQLQSRERLFAHR